MKIMKIMILSFISQTFSFNLNVTLRFDQSKFVICSPKQNFENMKILKLLAMKARNPENRQVYSELCQIFKIEGLANIVNN